MKIFIGFLLVAFSAHAQTQIDPSETTVLREVDERYLSFSLDTALLVGSYWWNETGDVDGPRGKEKIEPYNLLNEELIAKSKALAPAYFRVGGSEADKLYYNVKSTHPIPEGFDSQLKPRHLKDLRTFLERTKLELFFTLNSGPQHWKDGKYDVSNLRELLDFFSSTNYPVTKLEFGNEVLAYWALFGIDNALDIPAYNQAYQESKKQIAQAGLQTPLAAPASAFWPLVGEPLGEVFGKMENIVRPLKNNLDIITWHYYPTQSSRCPASVRKMHKSRFLDPVVLDEVLKWAHELASIKETHSPNAQLWLGETGSAQCGGQINVSDRYLSGFWWLDQLGALAKADHDVVVRQAIVGGDYSLLDLKTLEPRPDFWSSILWKKLMGERVLDLGYTNKQKQLRLYSHCHPKKGASILYLNLSPSDHSIKFPSPTTLAQYSLEATSISSKVMRLNGEKLTWPQGLELIKKWEIPKQKSSQFKAAKRSYGFVHLPEIATDICKNAGN